MWGILDAWRGYKSRVKKAHYTAYKTDEERIKNRPDGIPLAEFKLLLMYWGDEDVQPTPSDANVFVKTRKRRDGIEYKTDTAVMKYRIDKIEKAIG